MRLMLAPMEGVIDHTMRELLTSLGGIDRCVTEFVRSAAPVAAAVFRRLCPELAAPPRREYRSTYSCWAANRASWPRTPPARQQRAPQYRPEFCCPAKTVNRSDGGSIILREPQRVHDITAAVRRAVPAFQLIPIWE